MRVLSGARCVDARRASAVQVDSFLEHSWVRMRRVVRLFRGLVAATAPLAGVAIVLPLMLWGCGSGHKNSEDPAPETKGVSLAQRLHDAVDAELRKLQQPNANPEQIAFNLTFYFASFPQYAHGGRAAAGESALERLMRACKDEGNSSVVRSAVVETMIAGIRLGTAAVQADKLKQVASACRADKGPRTKLAFISVRDSRLMVSVDASAASLLANALSGNAVRGIVAAGGDGLDVLAELDGYQTCADSQSGSSRPPFSFAGLCAAAGASGGGGPRGGGIGPRTGAASHVSGQAACVLGDVGGSIVNHVAKLEAYQSCKAAHEQAPRGPSAAAGSIWDDVKPKVYVDKTYHYNEKTGQYERTVTREYITEIEHNGQVFVASRTEVITQAGMLEDKFAGAVVHEEFVDGDGNQVWAEDTVIRADKTVESKTTREYNTDGSVKHVTKVEYNGDGTVKSKTVTDSSGKTSTTEYNPDGTVKSTSDSGGSATPAGDSTPAPDDVPHDPCAFAFFGGGVFDGLGYASVSEAEGAIDPVPPGVDDSATGRSCFEMGGRKTSKCVMAIRCIDSEPDDECRCVSAPTAPKTVGAGRCARINCGADAACDPATGSCGGMQGASWVPLPRRPSSPPEIGPGSPVAKSGLSAWLGR